MLALGLLVFAISGMFWDKRVFSSSVASFDVFLRVFLSCERIHLIAFVDRLQDRKGVLSVDIQDRRYVARIQAYCSIDFVSPTFQYHRVKLKRKGTARPGLLRLVLLPVPILFALSFFGLSGR